jgi:integrase
VKNPNPSHPGHAGEKVKVMAVRKLGNGWQCDFYSLGERIRKVFRKKREAAAHERKTKASIRENKQGGFQTFKELSGWYLGLDDVKRKASFERDGRSVRKLNDFFGSQFLGQLTPSLVSAYQTKRMGEKSYRGEATKPATINREVSCLRTMFNKAIRDGKSERNPTKGVRFLRENNERDRVLSLEEWERYKAKCPPWYFPIAIMAYYTAMRKSEVVNIATSRIDLKDGFIRLKKEDTKTGEARSIPIHLELMMVLKKVLKVRPLNCDRVFHRNGRPINGENVRWAHERACRKANIKNFTFHDFRHTCINNWRREGHDYFKIMAASGHKTMSVFKRYNMVDEEELKSLVKLTPLVCGKTEGFQER